jgi:chaperonin GroEL
MSACDRSCQSGAGTYEDLVSAGVINPAKVVRIALQDAAFVAGLLITTEAIVTEAPKEGRTAASPPMDF